MKTEIAKQIKEALVSLAADDKLPLDMNELDKSFIEEILEHVEKAIEEKDLVLRTLKEDAEMALDGSWDCTTTEGKEGFSAQIVIIDQALNSKI